MNRCSLPAAVRVLICHLCSPTPVKGSFLQAPEVVLKQRVGHEIQRLLTGAECLLVWVPLLALWRPLALSQVALNAYSD